MCVKTLDNLNIPKEENRIFVGPDFARWPFLLFRNKLAIQNMGNLAEFRKEFLDLAVDYTREVIGNSFSFSRNQDIVVTGHQATWHHCGILAKNYITTRFAKAIKGGAIHLVLDHDVYNTAMLLPKSDNNDCWYFQKILGEQEQPQVPLEVRAAPQATTIEHFFEAVANMPECKFCDKIWFRHAMLRAGNIPTFRNPADFITYLQAMLYSALDINILYLPVSLLSKSDVFYSFATSIVVNALDFAKAYNEAIFEHVRKNKLKQKETIRPLTIDLVQGLVELPFWLIFPEGMRTTLYVKSAKDKIGIFSDEQYDLGLDLEIGSANQMKRLLGEHKYCLRPKAATLTLFVRLFLADWFVHGVGGAAYEAITDYILEKYYRIEGLSFGVATATMTLPLPGSTENTLATVSKLKQQLRSLRFNPEKFIDVSVCKNEPVYSLTANKSKLIKTASDCTISSDDRKSVLHEISLINEKLLKFVHTDVEDIQTKIKEAENRKLSQVVLKNREYFFGLFPEEMLRKLLGEEMAEA